MRVGYLLDANHREPGGAPPSPAEVASSMDALLEEAALAERAGFHSVAVPDRHRALECRFPGPEQLLTLLARETERVAIGTFTFVGTLVHPMKAAEQFAVIDNLSRGRLFTTVSRGFLPAFWGQFGVPEERMLGRLQETLRIWQMAFEGERFSFEGRHWQVREGMLAPRPYQDGGWPLWGGGNASPAAARRSADYAESWTADPLPMTDAVWNERAGAYRERALELGKRPYVVVMRDGWVADTLRAGGARVRRALRHHRALLLPQGSARRASRLCLGGRPDAGEARAASRDGDARAVPGAPHAPPRGARGRLRDALLPAHDRPVIRGHA